MTVMGRSMNLCSEFMKTMKKILILALVPYLVSCSYHEEECPSADVVFGSMRVELNPDGSTCETRSIISVPGIEDMINEISVAAYDKGTGLLADSAYSKSCPYLMLATDRSYNIYVIANMGDITGNFPDYERDIGSLKCTMSSFGNLKYNGLPMAGMTETAWKSRLAVEVRRLVAKVNITIDHSDMDSGGSDKSFSNTIVKVHRAARNLYPFREMGSAALEPDDLYPGTADCQGIADGYADLSEKLTLYVPENMQGTLLKDNEDPWGKDGDSGGFDASLCTYISLEGVKDGSSDGVEGDFVYRFFPGEDDTGNFDLRGNKVYDISMVLTWEGMYVADSWKVGRSNWNDSRRISVSMYEDHGYVSELKLVLPQGAADVPVYIHYSPHGEEYESEEAGGSMHHYEKGWGFMLMHPPSGGSGTAGPKDNMSEFSGTFMSTGFVEHQGYRTKHYVTISPSAPPGYTNRIIYRTVEGVHSAYLDIEVAENNRPGLSVGEPEEDGDNYIDY